jgi:ubiquinone/menaquinone biosynthesis C-methylase UbiE
MNQESDEKYTLLNTAIQKAMVKRKAEKEAAFFIKELKQGMTLLDCGCGPGSITEGFAKIVNPAKVVGVDADPVQIGDAQDRITKMGITNLSFQPASVYELPFEDNSFDAVFSHALLEHLHDPLKALSEMKRVLKPGGIIGARVPDHAAYLVSPDNELLKKGLKFERDLLAHKGGNPFIGRGLRGIFHEAGFINVVGSASYDHAGDKEHIELVSTLLSGSFYKGGLVDQLIELGWSNPGELKQISDEWEQWKDNPAAFFGVARCEAIGWKPV